MPLMNCYDLLLSSQSINEGMVINYLSLSLQPKDMLAKLHPLYAHLNAYILHL